MPKVTPQRSSLTSLLDYRHYVIGVDPGASGGVCVYEIDNGRPHAVNFYKLSKDTGENIDLFAKFPKTHLSQVGGHRIVESVTYFLEEISPSGFGWAKSSLAKLYGSYREIQTLCMVSPGVFRKVKATAWQRGLGLRKRKKNETTTEWKNYLKTEANNLFPFGDSTGRNGAITHATSDAFLIAEFGRRTVMKEEGRD